MATTTFQLLAPSGRRGLLVGAVLTLVVGAALGRFLTAGGVTDPPPALDQTLQRAVARLEQTVAERPDDLAAWQELGVLYTKRAAQGGDPAFYDLATKAFDEADGVEDGEPLTLIGRGNLALSLHRFDEALGYGERARAELPSAPDALGVVVDAEVELGHYDDAAAHLQQMLDVRPDLAALARASYLRELHGDLRGATIAMRQADAAGAGSPFDQATVVTLLGDLFFKQGDLAAAEAVYDRADQLASGIVAAEIGRARALGARGRYDDAIDLLSGVVDRVPVPGAVILLGELQQAAGHTREAGDSFALVRAIGTLQQQAGQSTDLEMAVFEADHGDPAVAVELARRAYDARPDNVYAADAVAWALLRHGRAAEAVPYVEQSLRLGTADALLRYHAAEVFAAAGQPDRARDELRRALERNRRFSVLHAPAAEALAAELGVTP